MLEILAEIARKGPQTVYELNAKTKDLSKPAIYRRLNGEASQGGLISENYLRLEGGVPFGRIQGRQKKYYGLALKGFLASLSRVTCERNYMFRIFLMSIVTIRFSQNLRSYGTIKERCCGKMFQEWHDLLKEREELRSLIVIPFRGAPHRPGKIPLPGVVGRILVGGPLYFVQYFPWEDVFTACWLTEEETKRLLVEYYKLDSSYPGLYEAFLNAYRFVIKDLPGTEPVWNVEKLILAGNEQERGS